MAAVAFTPWRYVAVAPVATSSGVLSSLFLAFKSAPLAINSSAISLLSIFAALCKGVIPSTFAFTSALLSIRSSAIFKLYFRKTARNKAVSPKISLAFTSAPLAINSSATSIIWDTEPYVALFSINVKGPLPLVHLSKLSVLGISTFATACLPFWIAVPKGVSPLVSLTLWTAIAFALAPLEISNSAAFSWPFFAASCKAVHPRLVFAFTSAPLASSSCIAVLPILPVLADTL